MKQNIQSLLIVLAGFLAIELLVCWQYRGPDVVASNAITPDRRFSAEAAMKIHARIFPEIAHPAGSNENNTVGNQLAELLREHGWIVEIQTFQSEPNGGVELRNIVARRSEHDELTATPVVLTSHYDSCRFGPGAGDAGGCVAAIVEASRLLITADSKLKRPVWLLFTDGEEGGLLGAREFVASHPLSQRRPLVLNFDARGCSGPVVMYETHFGNALAIEYWINDLASPRVTGSPFTAVYRSMPNGSDFSVFQQAGWPGFNFAIIDGAHRYHQPDDILANLNPRSVQHIGDQVLKMATRLCETSVDHPPSTEDAVFFDILGLTVIHYPTSWCMPLGIASLILSLQTNRRRLVARGLIRTLLGTWLTVFLILAISIGLGWALSMSLRDTQLLPRAFVWYGHWLSVSMWVVTMLVSLTIGVWCLRQSKSESIAASLCIAAGIVSLVIAVVLPEFSHLVLIPCCLGAVLCNSVRDIRFQTIMVTMGTGIILIPVQHLLAIAMGPANGTMLCPVFAMAVIPMLPLLGTHYSMTEK